MIKLTKRQILLLHDAILEETGGMNGVRDSAALDAAISAPFATFYGEDLFPSDIDKIARMSYGLTVNHAFVDGNKRIGAMVLQILLRENGYNLQIKEEELVEMFLSVAKGQADDKDLVAWIQMLRKQKNGNGR